MTSARLPGPNGAATPADGRRLRIVVAALWYHPERPSGSSRLAWDEAKYLAQRGHEVWLVALDGGSGQPEHFVDDCLHVLRYRRPASAALNPRAHRAAVQRLLRRHVPDPVDVVHAHALLSGAAAVDLYGGHARTCCSFHSAVRAELTAARRGAPVQERLRLRVAGMVRSRLEARLLSRCDVVTCFSAFTRGLLTAIHGSRLAGRLRVEPGWVDVERFRVLDDCEAAKTALGWPLDRPVLFTLRRLVPRMGLDTLLEAVAAVRASGRQFLLVIGGEGPWRGRLEAQAAALGLRDVVRFFGRAPEERLPMLYGAADAFVMPSAALECFGLPVLEAFACGRPVLATPVGAIPEVLEPVEPTWLAREPTTAAVAALLERYLRGCLPPHDPAALRRTVAARFSGAVRVPALAACAVGAGVDL